MKLAKIVAATVMVALAVIACTQPSTTNQTTTANTGANTASATPAPSAAQSQASPTDDMASVRAIYAAECARCHGATGEGGTATVLKKKLKVPSLRAGHALNHTDEELVKQIRDGKEGEMPAFGDRLKPGEINGLVRLIRQEFQAGAAKK